MKELAEALSKVQAQLKPAIKDTNNPFFNKKYADLSAVWEACREALTNNGFSVVQYGDSTENGQIVLVTHLLHSSGESIKGSFPIINTKGDAQGMGSAITYARRYGLAAMVGVCPEDDDATEAVKQNTNVNIVPLVKEHRGGEEQPSFHDEPMPNFDEMPNPSNNPYIAQHNTGEYICQVKKFKGRRLNSIDPAEVRSYVSWIEKASKDKNEPLKGVAKEFVDKAREYLRI
jgi:hypothetical protein